MKDGIHPKYMEARVNCACGAGFETMATQEEIHVDICSVCHPFYTGKQRLVDTAGRVERFQKRYGKTAPVAAEVEVETEVEAEAEVEVEAEVEAKAEVKAEAQAEAQ